MRRFRMLLLSSSLFASACVGAWVIQPTVQFDCEEISDPDTLARVLAPVSGVGWRGDHRIENREGPNTTLSRIVSAEINVSPHGLEIVGHEYADDEHILTPRHTVLELTYGEALGWRDRAAERRACVPEGEFQVEVLEPPLIVSGRSETWDLDIYFWKDDSSSIHISFATPNPDGQFAISDPAGPGAYDREHYYLRRTRCEGGLFSFDRDWCPHELPDMPMRGSNVP